LSDPRAAAPAPVAKAAGVGAAAPLTPPPEAAAATTPAASAVMPQAQDQTAAQTAVPDPTQAGAQTPVAAEVVVDPRPQALRGKPACRAPDPISLRAAEPGESAGAEAPLLPVASDQPLAATLRTAATPETPPPVDPAASLLSQLQLQLPPPPAPAFDPETARSSLAVVASADADATVATGALAGAVPVLSGEPNAGAPAALAAAADAGLSALAADSPSLPAVAEGGRGSDPLFALPASALGTVASAKLEPPPLPPPPVNTARQDWPEQLSSHISWQLGQDVQEARIELAPQDLGAIDLQVRVQDGRVQVHIGAAQQATRDLLSEALPRLRELLGDSGLSLSQASVFSQDAQSRGHQAWPVRGGREAGELAASELPVALTPPRARGLLDHYA
jgi:flagellar hook-length control protein FliK